MIESDLSLSAELDAVVGEYGYKEAAPGCGVMVSIGGEVLYTKCVGITDIREPQAITPETNFRMASVSKQFTAAAVLSLVIDGRLALETSLCELFDGLPAWGQDITIAHLLGHTGGLRDYEKHLPADLTEPVLDRDVLEIMKAQDKPNFTAGSQYAYSNSGYALLAMAVEARSGLRFRDYLRRQFFEPLGMAGTVVHEEGQTTVPKRAFGHRKGPGGTWVSKDGCLTSAVVGDGGVYTSLVDYAKWAGAWMRGGILPEQWRRRAWTNGALSDGARTEYGMGWRVSTVMEEKVVHHTGSTTGFNNFARLVPGPDICTAVFANRNGDEPKRMAPELERVVLKRLA